jgi:hypothetical protein
MMAASWRSAISTIVFPYRSGRLDGDRLGVKACLLRDASAVTGDALADVRGGAYDFDEVERAVGPQQRAVGGASVPGGVDCECGDRRTKAVLGVLDQPALLSVGVL